MRSKIRIENGAFTLIELLIAVSILSALLFTGTYSYQILFERWDKQLGSFESTANTAKSFNLIMTVLKGVQPFIVMDEQHNVKKPTFFFIGNTTRILSISSSGLFSAKYPEVFRLATEEKENGLFDLVYQSKSSQNVLLLTAQQEIKFEHQIVLLKDISDIKFRYLGWDGFMQKSNALESGLNPSWRPNFSGIDNQLLPIKMEVTIRQNEKLISFFVEFDQDSLRYLTPYFDDQA